MQEVNSNAREIVKPLISGNVNIIESEVDAIDIRRMTRLRDEFRIIVCNTGKRMWG